MGIKSQKFSRDQVRRAVSGLARAKVIDVQSDDMHLILKCLLASQYYPAQNKATTRPPQQAVINSQVKMLVNTVWRSQFKNEGFLTFAKKEWLEALIQFNDEVLNKAIIFCRDNCEMPPT